MKLSPSLLKYKSGTVNKGVKQILVTTQDLFTVLKVVELAAVLEVVEVVELAAEVAEVEMVELAVVVEVVEAVKLVELMVVELVDEVATCQLQILEEAMRLGMTKKQ